jgi:lysophospholipase L1-like esterase
MNLRTAPLVLALAVSHFALACSNSSSPTTRTGSETPASAGAGPASGGEMHWVGTWATALQTTEPRNLPTPAPDTAPSPENPGFAGNTLRQAIRVSMGGSEVRLRLSNEFGVDPVTFDAVHVAPSQGGGAIDAEADVALSFAGSASVTLQPGEVVSSDAFAFALAPLMDVAISIKFGAQSKQVTGHPGSRTTSYLQTGDAVTAPALPDALRTAHWYFISGLDVMAPAEAAAVVVLGDSLTDGRGTTTDGNDRWPDVLAQRLQADPALSHIGVLNMGIGGNAVVNGGIGPTAKTRFDHDVLGMPGVKWFIVLEGVNDIGGSSTDVSPALIAAYEEFVTKARAQNVKAFGSPILPFKTNTGYGTPARLPQRLSVNEWVRTSGTFDAVVDLDKPVQDPADPDKLLTDFATLPASVGTDFLHLNPAGYKAMGEAVDLTLFK